MLLLRCPICGSERLFIEIGDDVVFFCVEEGGKIVDLAPKDAQISVSESTEMACSGCAWNGTISGLVGEE